MFLRLMFRFEYTFKKVISCCHADLLRTSHIVRTCSEEGPSGSLLTRYRTSSFRCIHAANDCGAPCEDGRGHARAMHPAAELPIHHFLPQIWHAGGAVISSRCTCVVRYLHNVHCECRSPHHSFACPVRRHLGGGMPDRDAPCRYRARSRSLICYEPEPILFVHKAAPESEL